MRLAIGRLSISLLRFRFADRRGFYYSSPEWIGNGYPTAGGYWVDEPGGAWYSSVSLGRFELCACWTTKGEPRR
jgi:hypothetical protein